MDSLINAGMKMLSESNQGQQQQHQQQEGRYQQDSNPEYNPHGGRHDEFRNTSEEAARHAGSSASSDFFSSIVSSIGNKSNFGHEAFDEQDAMRKHHQVYNDGHSGDGSSLGAAAAMQALKKFAGGSQQQQQQPPSKSSFLATALGEASQLFDNQASQGKVQPGTTKESVVHKAGEYAMKMYIEHQAKQEGGLMSLATKFLNK